MTETALTTALNTSYMASQLALFGIVVGVALLLSGFGFAILAIGGALRNPENSLNFVFGGRKPKTAGTWFRRPMGPAHSVEGPSSSGPSTFSQLRSAQ